MLLLFDVSIDLDPSWGVVLQKPADGYPGSCCCCELRVGLGLVYEPNITLIPRAAPEMIGAFAPAVEHRFILPLVIGAAEREAVLRPNHECRSVATGCSEGLLQRVKLRTRHANIDGSLSDGKKVGAGLAQEFSKCRVA